MSMAPFFGVPGKLKSLLDRLTTTRAANLDNLNATISSRAPESTALSSSIWTNPRAINLDNLNATVSSRATQASVDVVDANVDSILARANAIPVGAIAKHVELTVAGNTNNLSNHVFSLGSAFDRGKSLVSISCQRAGSSPLEAWPCYYWSGTSEIRVLFFNGSGAVAPGSSSFVRLTVIEFLEDV